MRSKVKLKAQKEAWPGHWCRPVTGQDVPARGRAVADQKTKSKKSHDPVRVETQPVQHFLIRGDGRTGGGVVKQLHTTGWKPGMNTLTVLILENVRRTDRIQKEEFRVQKRSKFLLKKGNVRGCFLGFLLTINYQNTKNCGCPYKHI